MKTTEQRVAETILQKEKTVKVGALTFTVAPPSVATLILASEHISRLPQVQLDSDKIVEESLFVARECSAIGEVVATLIIGAKRAQKTALSRRLHRRRVRRLSRKLLTELPPSQLHQLVAELLKGMELGDFFALTTFLIELNLTRPTKVVNETTASGQ